MMLASIESSEEADRARAAAAASTSSQIDKTLTWLWTGGVKLSSWRWIFNGKPIGSFIDFKSAQPNDTKSCAMLVYSNNVVTLQTYSCDQTNHALCQYYDEPTSTLPKTSASIHIIINGMNVTVTSVDD